MSSRCAANADERRAEIVAQSDDIDIGSDRRRRSGHHFDYAGYIKRQLLSSGAIAAVEV